MSQQRHQYDPQFYRYINRGALDSAAVVLPLLDNYFSTASVLDVGCGAGAWLSVWKERDAEVLGLDGDYVDRSGLLINEAEFSATDLSCEFDLQRQFDLVQCLEVAEHLPETASRSFVASLCGHADVVLFSAAPPGQGGEHHINEQPYAYWRDRFEEQGFQMYDVLRGALSGQDSVMPWYRYNSFLYVRKNRLPSLHEKLRETAVAISAVPTDISPQFYQWRKRLVALLPVSAMTALATLKKHLLPRLPGTR